MSAGRRRPAGEPAGTPATAVLRAAGAVFTERAYPHDPRVRAFGDEAVAALEVAPELVFKTLVAADAAGSRLLVGIVPVAHRLDLKALARVVGAKKLALADRHTAERATGYVIGGISPFGQKQRLRQVLDDSALAFSRILVSGGRRGLDLEVSPDDLVRLTGATTAPIAR